MQQHTANRRSFLRGLAAVFGVATVASVAPPAAATTDNVAPATSAEPDNKGYRATAHVKKYYDKARF